MSSPRPRTASWLAAALLLVASPALALGPFRRVGIMTATAPELEPVVEALQGGREETVAGRVYHQGWLDGQEVVVVEGGVGKVNAALTATMLIQRYGVDLLLFTGVAASLDDDHSIGDVVVSERAVQVDYLKIAAGRATPATVKRIDHDGRHRSSAVAAPTALVQEALAAGEGADLDRLLPGAGRAVVVPGTVCTADAFVTDSRHARWVRKTFGGAVYEMEGAALAQVARSFGVPWLVFRGVSDHSNGFSSVTYPFTRKKAAANAFTAMRATLGRLQGR